MAAKPDPKEPKESAPAAPAEAAPASARGGVIRAWLPAVLAIVLAPVATFAVAEFVLLPRLQERLALPAVAAPAAPGHAGNAGDEKDKDGKDLPVTTHEFSNVVVNLAGTMGTRYLKTSFIVTGKNVKATFEGDKARLTDVTLSVLSSLTLADLEEPGAKNVLREKLVGAYNQVLGKRLVDQVYFSDFVIQ